MPKERNWQEDWDHVERSRWAKTLVNNPFPVQTLFGEIQNDTEVLAYWLQEYKQLKERYTALIEIKAALEAIMKLTSDSAAYTTAAKAYQIARKALEVEP